MARWVLRAEGVNFDATLLDTSDLSTVRGASLALLRLDEVVQGALGEDPGVRKLFAGASQCAFLFDAADTAAAHLQREKVIDALRAGSDGLPTAHLCVMVDVAPLNGIGITAELDALAVAEARNRTRQFRSWTLDPLPPERAATRADALDGVRPAGDVIRRPAGDTGTLEDLPVSRAVKAKRDFGRTARQDFYASLAGLGPDVAQRILGSSGEPCFTDSIEDIVATPPDGLPLSVRGKVALVYADGNGFGAKVKQVGPERFSAQLAAQRRNLLAAVLSWYAEGARGESWRFFAAEVPGKQPRLRFETLLWGGDEFAFAMPAWLVFPFLEGLFAMTAGWQVQSEDGTMMPLTHAVGVAIANRKTPIRQLHTIAKAAADLSKDSGLKGEDSVAFEIYESLTPPDLGDGLSLLRARAFGADAGLDASLGFPGRAFCRLTEGLATLSGGAGFPRSQLYGALRAARDAAASAGAGRGLFSPAATQAVEAHLDAYQRRPGGLEAVNQLRANLPPGCAGASRPLPVALALIAQLWDYAKAAEVIDTMPVATTELAA